jgi:hypothetical protein
MLDFTEEFLSGSIGFNLLAYRTVYFYFYLHTGSIGVNFDASCCCQGFLI